MRRYADDRGPIDGDPFQCRALYFLPSYSVLRVFSFFTHFIFSLFKIFYFRNETNDGIRGRTVARKASKLSDESPPIESVEKEKATS